MKKIISMLAIAFLCSNAIKAQDTASYKKPPTASSHPHDSIPNASDTSGKNKKWNTDKMPNDKKRKNWPDSMGRIDTLRRE